MIPKNKFIVSIIKTLESIDKSSIHKFESFTSSKVLRQEQADFLNHWFVEFLVVQKYQQTNKVSLENYTFWFYENLRRLYQEQAYLSLITCQIVTELTAKGLATGVWKEGLFHSEEMKVFLQNIRDIPSEYKGDTSSYSFQKANAYVQIFHDKLKKNDEKEKEKEKEFFNDYQITSELGRGGMGIVYKVLDTRLNRYCALKVITNQNVTTKSSQRFMQEIKTVAALQHPNIVQLYDVGSDPQMYFTMEYIEGKSLKQKIPQLQYKFKEIAQITIKICDAMAFVHSKQIIHRDIKPDNIMLTNSNEPKVMDFGLAKMEGQFNSLSGEGDVIGTPVYMSPEQAEAKEVDAQTDVYSIGATLYEMLTGRPPFQSSQYTQLVYYIMNEDPISPKALNSDIPKELSLICLKCLEKSKNRRYKSSKNVSEDLQNYLEHKPISIKAEPIHRIKKWCYRHKFLTITFVFLSIFIAVIMWFSYEKWQTSQDLAFLNEQLELNNKKTKQALHKSQLQLIRAHVKMAEYHYNKKEMDRAKLELDNANELIKKNKIPLKDKVYIEYLQKYTIEPNLPQQIKEYIISQEYTSYDHNINVHKNYVAFVDTKGINLWKLSHNQTMNISNPILIPGQVPFTITDRYLLCFSKNKLKIYDIYTSTSKTHSLKLEGDIHFVEFSEASGWIAIKSNDLLLFHPETNESFRFDIGKYRSSRYNPISFHNKGKTLIGTIDSSICVWKLIQNKWKLQKKSYSFLGKKVVYSAISPDKNILIYGDDQGKIFILNFQKDMTTSLDFHKAGITKIVFNENGRIFITADKEGRFIIWDSIAQKPLVVHQSSIKIRDITFITDKMIAMIGSVDNLYKYQLWTIENHVIKELQVKDGTMIKIINALGVEIKDLPGNPIYFNRTNNYIAALYISVLAFWNVAENKNFVLSKQMFLQECVSCDFSPDGKLLGVLFSNGEINIIDTSTSQTIQVIPPKGVFGNAHAGFIICSDRILIYACQSGPGNYDLEIFDFVTKQKTQSIPALGEITFGKISDDNKKLAVGNMVGQVYIFDLENNYIKDKNPIVVDTKTKERIRCMSWSFDNKKLAISVRANKQIFFYEQDGKSYTHKNTILGYEQIENISFSPDAKKIAIFAHNTSFIYHLEHGFKVEMAPSYYKKSAGISKDWKYLAFSSMNGNVILYNVETKVLEKK